MLGGWEYFLIWGALGGMLFCLFEMLVWIPMVQARNLWVRDAKVKLIDTCVERVGHDNWFAEYSQYWTYNQMYSCFHITDVEKMKGEFKRPWYLIGDRGIFGCKLSENELDR